MTRQDFLDNVTSFDDLIDFCSDEGCDYCEDIYYEDSFDELINDSLSSWARDLSWYDLRDRLNDLPRGYTWYECSDDWRGLDGDDFDDYKDDVLRWGDDNDIWDAPEEADDDEIEDLDEELFEDDDEYEEPEDGCSFGELFAASSSVIQKVTTDESDDDEAAAMIQMLMYS